MTLQALRNRVGDDAFWTTLHLWTEQHAFGTGTTDAFITLAEQVSGQDLSDLFHVWLFTPGRPPASAVAASGVVTTSPTATAHASAWLRAFARRTAP
jgi:aminopeptidase N